MSDLKQTIEDYFARERVTDSKIRQFGSPAVPILIDIFEQAKGELQDRMRQLALHSLGVLGTQQAIDFLIDIAQNPEVALWLRREAVDALGMSENTQVLAFLVSMLESPDVGIRKSAMLALGRSSDPQARSVLENVHATDPDIRIREHAARAMGIEPPSDEAKSKLNIPDLIIN